MSEKYILSNSDKSIQTEPSKLIKSLLSILLLLCFLLTLLSSYLIYRNNLLSRSLKLSLPKTGQQIVNENPVVEKNIGDTSDWKTYQSNSYGVSFKYPSNWEILEVENPAGGPSPFVSKQIYFMKKYDDGNTYYPSYFSIRLYKNIDEDESEINKEGFKEFYINENAYVSDIIEKFEDYQKDPYITLENIDLGGKNAVLFIDPTGMFGELYLFWYSDKKAVFIGTFGLFDFYIWGNVNPKFGIGEPFFNEPYSENDTFIKIISSFVINDSIIEDIKY